MIIKLSNGLGIFFSPEDAQGLEGATAAQLSDVELTPSGLGLHFEKLDADVWIPSLLEASSVPASGWPPVSARKAASPAARPSAPPLVPMEPSAVAPENQRPDDCS